MSPLGCKNTDLESQDPIFYANMGQDENLIWTKKLRRSHTNKHHFISSLQIPLLWPHFMRLPVNFLTSDILGDRDWVTKKTRWYPKIRDKAHFIQNMPNFVGMFISFSYRLKSFDSRIKFFCFVVWLVFLLFFSLQLGLLYGNNHSRKVESKKEVLSK